MARSYRSLIVGAALAIVVGIVALRLVNRGTSVEDARRAAAAGCSQVASAYDSRRSDLWLTMSAPVSRLLPNSYGRFEHERFILRCPSGQTVLIENDVSVGQRVPVGPGDPVAVHGQYIWNPQGGLIHYTHRGNGWILFRGKLYE